MFVEVDEERTRHLDMFIGLLDGSLSPGESFDDDEQTDRPVDADDPFRP
jgi:hypothetical protein